MKGVQHLMIPFILLGLQTAATAAAPIPDQLTHPCKLPGVAQSVRCGTIEVLENPELPKGRTLTIHYAVIRAASGRALEDPIVPLEGGPGEDAIGAAAVNASKLAPLLSDRDLLLVDQRGTGKSAPLKCQLFSVDTAASNIRDVFPLDAVERCRRRLEQTADLKRYTYLYFASDLEAVRQALGYGPINIFAGSYGTRAAQVYLREHPRSVRTAYLGSVVPINAAGPLDFAKTEQTALERTFDDCEADTACHTAFPDLRSEFRQMLGKLSTGEMRVHVPGNAATAALGRGRVAEWVRSRLYRPGDAAALPWIIHRTASGDWDPIVEGILSGARDGEEDLSFGLFFAVTCSEDMPFIHEQEIAAKTRGTFLGDYRIREQQAACKHWPQSALPKNYRTAVTSTVPTLFVTGDRDGGTPLWFTDRVSGGFSNHLTIVVHGQGHTEWNDCVARAYESLVRLGSVRGLNAYSCPPISLPPFKT